MDIPSPCTLTEQMLRRIRSEYVEMPGLRLTRQQAQRLWGLDENTCSTALELLVEAKFLWRTDDMYLRVTAGPMAFPRLRMAGARLDHTSAARVGLRGGLSL